LKAEGTAEFIKDFEREKCDLSFVIVPIIKKSISANTMTCDAFDARDFQSRKIVGRAAMMAEEVMAV
jgi:hypothetical protein